MNIVVLNRGLITQVEKQKGEVVGDSPMDELLDRSFSQEL